MKVIPTESTYFDSNRTLALSTTFWFIITAIGQVLFVSYIVLAYGGHAYTGNLEAWKEMTLKGYVENDTRGNIFFASHLIMAVILTLGGLLQIVPWIRKKALKFHKYNGRIFIITAIATSLGGLYLVWIRDATLSANGSFAISINALLIMFFSYKTISTARAKKISNHRRWALRTFLVVNGVWFFRIGFMAWILIHQEAKWSTENLDGPFDLVWAYANYLLPLIVLELYFKAKDSEDQRQKYFMAALLFICTIITAVGIAGAYLIMWGPSM